MNGIWIATMFSENYEWTAIGNTQDEAISAIAKEWQEGVGHENRTQMTKEELESYYGVYCRFIEFGKCEWR